MEELDEERNDVLSAICKQLEENRKILIKLQEILGNFCSIIDSRLTTLENSVIIKRVLYALIT